MELEKIQWRKDGKFARVTFNRPRVLNAMDNQTTVELNLVAAALAKEREVRVVIVTGAGRSFSTGIDLKELAAGEIDMSYHHRFEPALRAFEMMDKIVIAGIKQYCLGGALQFALACDIRVAADDAILGLPAVKEGFIPGMGTWRLARYVGLGRAKRLTLSGDNVTAAEALQIGLVDHVVPLAEFEARLDEIAQHYLQNCSEGTRQAKQLLNTSFDLPFESFLREYFRRQEIAQASADHAEAKRAYQEQREPVWK